MAKILCVDDYRLYAEMVGAMLAKHGGYEVKVDVVPLVMDEVKAFAPDVIVLNMVRKAEVLGSPILDFEREVDGAKALRVISEAPETRDIPLVLTALAVKENELPHGYHYEAFIEVPQKIDVLRHTVDRLVQGKRRQSEVIPE